MANLSEIRSKTSSVAEYIENLKGKDKDILLEKYEDYKLNEMAMAELQGFVNDLTLIVFSAAWCKDCTEAIPVLLHLEKTLNLDIRVFGKVKSAPLDQDHQWAIPPSPPEIEDWGVTAIPWIAIFNKNGESLGEIVEKAVQKPTLEEELLFVLMHK